MAGLAVFMPREDVFAENLQLHAGEAPEGLSVDDWEHIRARIAADEYRAYPHHEGGYTSTNPAHGWQIRFSPDGTTLLTPRNPEASQYQLGLKLEALGYGKLQTLAQPQKISAVDEIVTYQWNPFLRELWVNQQSDLEQWFVLEQRPAWAATGQPLTLQMSLKSDLVASQTGNTIHFKEQSGLPTGISYDKLKVWDSTGTEMPARMKLQDTSLELLVDDSQAVYPLTIDPSYRQQAYVNASNAESGDSFGYSIAISGETLVVGAYLESSNATGVNGDQDNNLAADSGAVYVFVRSAGAWSQQAYLKASNTESGDHFGESVAISGDTLVVGAPYEDSGATGVNGSQSSSTAPGSGAAYVFGRDAGTWSQQAYLKASNTNANDNFGGAVAISGSTLVVGAKLEDSDAHGVDGDGGNNLSNGSGAAYVFHRLLDNWFQAAYLKASNSYPPNTGDQFGASVAISGNTVVVGAPMEDGLGTGVNPPEIPGVAQESGAAYVFVRDLGLWKNQAYIKASNAEAGDQFGHSVAISTDTLVVGAPFEDSASSGVNGNQTNDPAPDSDSGSAYVFGRSDDKWSQQAYLKASNAEPGDQFGHSVSASHMSLVAAPVLAVGARYEDSDAIGTDGDEENNRSTDSGAIYVFVSPFAVWQQRNYLKAAGTGDSGRFGRSVAVSGDILAASDASGNSYLFDFSSRVGGTVSGLVHATAVTLENDKGDDLYINADGPFTFPTAYFAGDAYNVSVQTHPSFPAQHCEVFNGTGLAGLTDITDVTVTCSLDNNRDTDEDGIGDNADNCVFVPNADQTNTDGDNAGDACDLDDDNDGLPDSEEDRNGNGIVDAGETDPLNADSDDDGTGDATDNCPTLPNAAQTDTDSDDYGDFCDSDDDNDGLLDDEEDSNGNSTVDPGETDPLDPDSDDDDFDDGMEVTHGSNPLVAGSVPAHGDTSLNACLADATEASVVSAYGKGLFRQIALGSRSSVDGWLFSITDDLAFVHHPESLEIEGVSSAGDSITGASPVEVLDDGAEYLFVTRDSGILEKLSVGASSVWTVDLTHGESGDTLAAIPVAHLHRHASAAYQAEYANDLVYAGTTHGGSDKDTDNRIYAIDADTGAIAWIFNNGASVEMDAVQGLALDESNDVLFVATSRTHPEQDSLLAIDVLTATVLWSQNVGELNSRKPLLMDDRVYSVSLFGEINVMNKATGGIIQTLPVGDPVLPIPGESKIARTNTGETVIASVDFLGGVAVVRDNGQIISQAWHIPSLPEGVEASLTALEFDLAGENLFVGGKDGRVYQLDVATGIVIDSRSVSDGKEIVRLAAQGPFSGILVDVPRALYAQSDDGVLARLCQPFRTNTSPTDTDADDITDGADNCPSDNNPSQSDVDGDGIGDACDTDHQFFFRVGGTLTGLVPGSSVVLRNSSDAMRPSVAFPLRIEDLELTENGSFTFTRLLYFDTITPSPYEVTVLIQPDTPEQECLVTNGSGTVAGVEISDIVVSCTVIESDGDADDDGIPDNLDSTPNVQDPNACAGDDAILQGNFAAGTQTSCRAPLSVSTGGPVAVENNAILAIVAPEIHIGAGFSSVPGSKLFFVVTPLGSDPAAALARVSDGGNLSAPETIFSQGFERCSPSNRVAWDGGGDGTSWADAANWEGDALPQDGSSITIQSSNPQMIGYDVSLGTTRLDCLDSNRGITITGGDLEIIEFATVSPEISITGGSLTVTGRLEVVGE
jgi:hypothetical protein